jgi:hypothetical protein
MPLKAMRVCGRVAGCAMKAASFILSECVSPNFPPEKIRHLAALPFFFRALDLTK